MPTFLEQYELTMEGCYDTTPRIADVSVDVDIAAAGDLLARLEGSSGGRGGTASGRRPVWDDARLLQVIAPAYLASLSKEYIIKAWDISGMVKSASPVIEHDLGQLMKHPMVQAEVQRRERAATVAADAERHRQAAASECLPGVYFPLIHPPEDAFAEPAVDAETVDEFAQWLYPEATGDLATAVKFIFKEAAQFLKERDQSRPQKERAARYDARTGLGLRELEMERNRRQQDEATKGADAEKKIADNTRKWCTTNTQLAASTTRQNVNSTDLLQRRRDEVGTLCDRARSGGTVARGRTPGKTPAELKESAVALVSSAQSTLEAVTKRIAALEKAITSGGAKLKKVTEAAAAADKPELSTQVTDTISGLRTSKEAGETSQKEMQTYLTEMQAALERFLLPVTAPDTTTVTPQRAARRGRTMAVEDDGTRETPRVVRARR